MTVSFMEKWILVIINNYTNNLCTFLNIMYKYKNLFKVLNMKNTEI